MPPRGGRNGKLEKPRDAKGTIVRTLKYMMNYRYVVLILLLCTFVSNIGNLLGPLFAGKAIGGASFADDMVGRVDFDTVFHYAKLMLIAYLASNVLSFTVNLGMMRVSRKVAQKMRRDVFEKLMVLPVSYFDSHQAGDIISRVSYH